MQDPLNIFYTNTPFSSSSGDSSSSHYYPSPPLSTGSPEFTSPPTDISLPWSNDLQNDNYSDAFEKISNFIDDSSPIIPFAEVPPTPAPSPSLSPLSVFQTVTESSETSMCYTCSACFESTEDLHSHVIEEHAQDLALLNTKRPRQYLRKYHCPYCQKLFNRRHDLERHLPKHTKEANYPCEHCGKRFTRKDAMKRHVELNRCKALRKE